MQDALRWMLYTAPHKAKSEKREATFSHLYAKQILQNWRVAANNAMQVLQHSIHTGT